ncbi:sialoadhesin [Scomber scombrus]|uniref:sialoadhesin n=1 Tax=Scomber scombrus TaxID=13677 RepID=UPI002DD8928F|nr:sialoadhesin [Scomber scombrus]
MLPQRITAINGSCVTIPCQYEVPKGFEPDVLNCSKGAVWKKGDALNPPVFNGETISNTQIKGQLLGDLTKKNCTTMFHSLPKGYDDIYFFRLECTERIKFSFPYGVYITQQDPPPPEMTTVTQVLEGVQMMRVRCSVPVPCPALPPSITWLPRDDSRQEQTEILKNPEGQTYMTSTLTFITSAELHNRSIICSVSYPLAKGGSTEPSSTTQIFNILYAPRSTEATLSMPGAVSEGRTVTFTCFSDANPPVRNYTWYRNDIGNLTKMGERRTMVLRVTKRDSGLYLCEAQNQKGSQRSRAVYLDVISAAGSSDSFVMFTYVIGGVVVFLYILTVVVVVCNLSKRLEQIELKEEQTYTNLRRVDSDYDHIQPKSPSISDVPDYENPIALRAILKNQPLPKHK